MSDPFDRLAATTGVLRLGEASALARYTDLPAMPGETAFRLGHADGAAAAVASFPAVVFGLFSLTEWVERLCDPDAVPGTARPEGAGPLFEAPPGISLESAVGRKLVETAFKHAAMAAGLAPLDAYVVGFKAGAAAGLAAVRDAANACHDFADDLAHMAYGKV